MTLNVTMLTKDRPELTKQAISSLYANTAEPFTLTIVDDISTTKNLDALHELQRRLGFYLIVNEEPQGTGMSRNIAIAGSEERFGRAHYLYISDNDAYFTEGWDAPLIANYPVAEALGFRLLGAYNHPYHHPIGMETEAEGEVYEGVDGYHLNAYYSVGTMSWLMTWRTWDKYGPLQHTPANAVNQGDDHEFCQAIRKDGYKVGTIWPHTVINCGKTDCLGKPSPGAELIWKQEPPKGVIIL